MDEQLTERQQRELEYHRHHAETQRSRLEKPVAFDVVESEQRRWWNAYWHLWTIIRSAPVREARALVVGCGFGGDAILLSALVREVQAFDLSPESLEIAEARAKKFARGPIEFRQCPAEAIPYADDEFDFILVYDILHHCDIEATLEELRRVAKPGCLVIGGEPYTHSFLQAIRESTLVDRLLYPQLRKLIYDSPNPYITEDETKLTLEDVNKLTRVIRDFEATYFDFFVRRFVPQITSLAKIDRRILEMFPGFGRFAGGKILYRGHF